MSSMSWGWQPSTLHPTDCFLFEFINYKWTSLLRLNTVLICLCNKEGTYHMLLITVSILSTCKGEKKVREEWGGMQRRKSIKNNSAKNILYIVNHKLSILTNVNTAFKVRHKAPTPIQSNSLANYYFNSFINEPYHFSEFNTTFEIYIHKVRQSLTSILKCIFTKQF